MRGDGLPGRVVVLLVFLSCFSPAGFAADNANPRSSASVPTIHPETLQQVRDIESQVRQTIRKVLPCVVGVERSSGTIVSAEGHVLCAAHTVKAPGREVAITLADGKKLKGKVLGVNVELDGAMVKIEAEGPFPFVELGRSDDLRPGQWCLDAGHPGGFRKDRPAVFRLGRVREVTRGSLMTDNYTTGGDSGGPVFDLAGRLIGTHSRGGPISTNAPIDPYRQSWERFLAGKKWGQRRQSMMMQMQMQRYVRPDRAQQALAELVVEPSRSVIRVFCDGREKCLGTVVEKGLVVTKASELDGKITCRDRDEQQWPARLIGADASHDLALLKLPSTPLVPIAWADAGAPAPGQWVAAPSADGKVLGAGIVGVPEKVVARSPGTVGVHFAPAEAPVTVQEVLTGTGAEEAGLQAGDVITAVNGKPAATVTALLAALRKHQPGDAVTLSVKRGEQASEVGTTLDEFRMVPKRFAPRGRMIRAGKSAGVLGFLGFPAISTRRHGFPAVIQHDSVLSAPECGGPLIDLSGKAVGVNIARVGGFRTYALPAHVVIAVVKQLKLARKPEVKAEPKPGPKVGTLQLQQTAQRLEKKLDT